MSDTITLEQNVPTRAWGVRLIATNFHEGSSRLFVEQSEGPAEHHDVRVGDEVGLDHTVIRVDAITGGGERGAPGRGSGRLVVRRVTSTEPGLIEGEAK